MAAVLKSEWTGTRANLVTIRCFSCQTEFAMDEALYDARYADHRNFWCPNGHDQHFIGKTEDQRKIAQLEAERDAAKRDAESQRRSREWAERTARGANVKAGKARAALRRLNHRVNCGVCPHCQRTFKQLAAHMKTKHADVL